SSDLASSEDRGGKDPRGEGTEHGGRGAREKKKDRETARVPAWLDLRSEAPDEEEIPEDGEDRDVDERVRHEAPDLPREKASRQQGEKARDLGQEEREKVAGGSREKDAPRHGRDAAPAGRARPAQPVGRPHRPEGSTGRFLVTSGPRPEDRAAHAHERRTFLDRGLEIVAHPHREIRKAENLPEVLEGREMRARFPRRGDRHESAEVERRQRPHARDERGGIRRVDAPPGGSSRRARSRESIVWTTAATFTARFALFDWIGPMRWPSASGGRCGNFPSASWTRFSPNARTPAAWAARRSGSGYVFPTATRRTLSGERPLRTAAAAMRLRTSARLVAISSARVTALSPLGHRSVTARSPLRHGLVTDVRAPRRAHGSRGRRPRDSPRAARERREGVRSR